jgi:two-component system sensor histidine kinase/response regulator
MKGRATRPIEGAEQPHHPPMDPTPLSRPIRVLVADDNATNQRVATLILAKIGWEAQVVSNGAEAVRAWRGGSFDIILMDCQMPEMDGFEATRAIRAAEPPGVHQAIVAITANAEHGARQRCLSAGMDDYVTKPLSKAALVEMWERLNALQAKG